MPTRIFFEIIGIAAGILTTVSFIPQIVKGYRTKNLEGVSLLMYLILTSGFSMWLLYGILIKALAVVVANIFAIAFSVTILIMKSYYIHGQK